MGGFRRVGRTASPRTLRSRCRRAALGGLRDRVPGKRRGVLGPRGAPVGDHLPLVDKLLSLVIDGPKRATAGLVADFIAEREPLPRIGGHMIACDGAGVPRVVLRTTELRIGPFSSVDAKFAYDEGEDDRTLEGWVEGHRPYFERVSSGRGKTWHEDDEVVFERFQVVWPLEHSDH